MSDPICLNSSAVPVPPRRVFSRLADHDPSGGTRKRTLRFTLDTGDSLTADTALVLYNADGSALDVGEDIVIEGLELGRISASPQGDVWGINFRLRYGKKKGVDYLLTVTPWLASQPTEPQYDKTFAFLVLDT